MVMMISHINMMMLCHWRTLAIVFFRTKGVHLRITPTTSRRSTYVLPTLLLHQHHDRVRCKYHTYKLPISLESEYVRTYLSHFSNSTLSVLRALTALRRPQKGRDRWRRLLEEESREQYRYYSYTFFVRLP